MRCSVNHFAQGKMIAFLYHLLCPRQMIVVRFVNYFADAVVTTKVIVDFEPIVFLRRLEGKITDYSERKATTGSFLAAEREGMMPAMSVSNMLIVTKIAATPTGNEADKVAMPVSECKIRLIGMHKR